MEDEWGQPIEASGAKGVAGGGAGTDVADPGMAIPRLFKLGMPLLAGPPNVATGWIGIAGAAKA